jgi:hypothetical protein
MATNRHSGLRLVLALAGMLGLLVMSGCVGQGILYTRVVRPNSTDFRVTPAGSNTCRMNQYNLREPVTGADVSVEFTLRVVEQAAREAGITKLYYADIETFSILNGAYEKKTLIVYGD